VKKPKQYADLPHKLELKGSEVIEDSDMGLEDYIKVKDKIFRNFKHNPDSIIGYSSKINKLYSNCL
jgi:hypothetical protein